MFDFIIGFLSESCTPVVFHELFRIVSYGMAVGLLLPRVGGYSGPKWIYDKIIDKYRTDNTRLKI